MRRAKDKPGRKGNWKQRIGRILIQNCRIDVMTVVLVRGISLCLDLILQAHDPSPLFPST